MTLQDRKRIDKYQMLKKLFASNSRIYSHIPNAFARNQAELEELEAYFADKPKLLKRLIEQTKPRRIYRRRDVAAWQLRIVRNKKAYAKPFYDKDYGSEAEAKFAAERYLKKLLSRINREQKLVQV